MDPTATRSSNDIANRELATFLGCALATEEQNQELYQLAAQGSDPAHKRMWSALGDEAAYRALILRHVMHVLRLHAKPLKAELDLVNHLTCAYVKAAQMAWFVGPAPIAQRMLAEVVDLAIARSQHNWQIVEELAQDESLAAEVMANAATAISDYPDRLHTQTFSNALWRNVMRACAAHPRCST